MNNSQAEPITNKVDEAFVELAFVGKIFYMTVVNKLRKQNAIYTMQYNT